FYGIRPEPNGLYKNRTGAIYKIQAGDRIWHLNRNEPAIQNYTPGPPLEPGVWFEYEITAWGDDYTVSLANLKSGVRVQTTTFHNTDPERGRSPGFIGLQAYPGNVVAWRHIRIMSPVRPSAPARRGSKQAAGQPAEVRTAEEVQRTPQPAEQ